MKISELEKHKPIYTQLGMYVLAVLVRREIGWVVYVDAVPGHSHIQEYHKVAAEGAKQKETVAKAIAQTLFHPGFEIDLPYEE